MIDRGFWKDGWIEDIEYVYIYIYMHVYLIVYTHHMYIVDRISSPLPRRALLLLVF